ncbi:MAG: 30S ribosomal protein S6 [Bacteriovoracaceae bacterium]|nr:30S ribosomal protein S6 [Bacteroidota bacterium]
MQHQPKIYESIIIINATLEDAQIEAEIEKIKDFITKNTGEIRALEKWGRRRLAYAIKKKNNGFYVLYEFKAQGDLIAKLERQYLLNENVIRFLTVELNKKALKAREVGQKTPISESIAAEEAKAAAAAAAAQEAVKETGKGASA